MTRFVIGVGHLSVSGGDIERTITDLFPGSEVNPIQEAPYQESSLASLYKRAAHFAERMRMSTCDPADYFVGVASGNFKVGLIGRHTKQLTRVEIFSVLYRNGKMGSTGCLNPLDIQWQIDNHVCAEASCLESVTRLMIVLHQVCKARTPP